jgi:hypothetical protein
MIEDKIKIHDRHQFELKVGYSLADLKKYTNYNVDIYFFLSGNLGINTYTYKKDDFYNDLQTYTRLNTPAVLLKNLCLQENSPFEKLKKHFKDITLKNNANFAPEEYYAHIKLFCCAFKNALAQHTDFIKTKKDIKDTEFLITEYIEQIQTILNKYKKLRTIITIPTIKNKMFAVYQYGEEYLYYLIEDNTFPFLEWLNQKKAPDHKKIKEQLLSFLKNLQETKKIYSSEINKENNYEKLIFRKSVLKKYMSNILYLSTYKKRGGKMLEQLIMSIAAGLAMIFATLVAFIAQRKLGLLTVDFFIILVISYMFKDRIKDITKYYLNIKLRSFIFDHVTNLYNSARQKVGICKESFGFVDISKVPSGILNLKNKDLVTKIDPESIEEDVILYKRQIKIYSKPFQKAYKYQHIDGIQEIFRYNVQNFLKRMDDPKKELYLTSEDSYNKIYGNRVYYLNIVIKYTQDQAYYFNTYRLTLNQEGIKKINKIYSNKETALPH